MALGGELRKITMRVSRYRPEREEGPTFQEYEVPFRDDWVVLDGLNWIKDNVDGGVTFRWSCRMGVCGSCGMTVNGVPRLTCATFLRDYMPGPVVVEPMANFPVIRDLVVDVDDFMEKLKRVQPWIVRKEGEKPVSEGEYRQSPKQLEHFKQFSACINCLLCYAACPVYGLDPEFIGPAAIALAHRYNMDSRDEGRAARLKTIGSNAGVWKCTFVGECSEVCPKHVDPAAAIQRSKVAAVNDWALSFILPRGGET